MQTRRILLSVAVLSMLAPVSAAQWVAWQTVEPDNALDTPDFMWQDAPGSAKDRVYFAVISYQMEWVATGVIVNPNVAALGTNNEAANGEYHEALFGVWTDCNGDGYVGMAEGALREYSAALLLDDTLCPPVTGSNQRWTAGAHNYNQLVSEFIPIARDPTSRDVRVYRDDGARVWGDFGKWNEAPTQRSCALNPQPRGTYQSTGGTLNYVDCRVDILGTWNVVDAAAGTGMSFSDDDDAENSFADLETFGSEDTQYSPASVWDCDAGYVVRSGDVLNESGVGEVTADESGGGPNHDVVVYGVDPQLAESDPTTWTVPALYNETNEGLEGGDTNPEGNDACDTSDDRGADWYGGVMGEADFNGVNPENKHEADWNFGFVTSNRGGAPVSLLGAIGGSGAAGYNEGDLGVGEGGSRWTSDSVWASKPGPAVIKTNLEDTENPEAGLADAYWLTFYAYVTPDAVSLHRLALPGGGATGIYGGPQCGDATSGTPMGFNCDRDTWYVNPDGTVIPDDEGELARVFDPYNLRDSDCYDGNVGAVSDLAGQPVGVQPASYGDNPCP